MKLNSKVFIVFILIAISFSCRREGLGGDNTLVVYTKHNSGKLKGATIYVRFGAKDFPGSSRTDYDFVANGISTQDSIHVRGLRKGDYFVYGTGYDSVTSTLVSGGDHIFISSKSGETEMNLQLKE